MLVDLVVEIFLLVFIASSNKERRMTPDIYARKFHFFRNWLKVLLNMQFRFFISHFWMKWNFFYSEAMKFIFGFLTNRIF